MRVNFHAGSWLLGLAWFGILPVDGQSVIRLKDGFPPVSCSDQQAADGIRYLQSHPEDTERASCLLAYYIARWPQVSEDQELRAGRLRVIVWVIENHPDIDLTPYDSRGLYVNPDDKEEYAQARALWLRQVELHPDNARVLANAADGLALTDRETAANLLRKASKLPPLPRTVSIRLSNGEARDSLYYKWVDDLARVYAAAIAGISGEAPRGEITSVDSAEMESAFAKSAFDEASSDPELPSRVGQQLHSYSKSLRYTKLSAKDFDDQAELLLLKAVSNSYPSPGARLKDFYKDRGVTPKFETIDIPAAQQAEQLVSPTLALVVSGKNDVKADVHVIVDILIGIDGYVWMASGRSAAVDSARQDAQAAAYHLEYRQPRSDGRPVQISTQVEITVVPNRRVLSGSN